MKKFVLVFFLILLLIVSCSPSAGIINGTVTPKNIQPSNDECLIRLEEDKTSSALSGISFLVPEDWQEIHVKESYTSADLTSSLHVFIFETKAKPIICVETMVDVVSQYSAVESVQILNADVNIEGNPATIMKADGYSNSSKQVSWQGIFTGFAYEDLVFVFVWDAIGQDAIETIVYEASYTIETIQLN